MTRNHDTLTLSLKKLCTIAITTQALQDRQERVARSGEVRSCMEHISTPVEYGTLSDYVTDQTRGKMHISYSMVTKEALHVIENTWSNMNTPINKLQYAVNIPAQTQAVMSGYPYNTKSNRARCQAVGCWGHYSTGVYSSTVQ